MVSRRVTCCSRRALRQWPSDRRPCTRLPRWGSQSTVGKRWSPTTRPVGGGLLADGMRSAAGRMWGKSWCLGRLGQAAQTMELEAAKGYVAYAWRQLGRAERPSGMLWALAGKGSPVL